MDPRAVPFASLLRLNTRLLLNCLEGLSDDQASVRVLPPTNSVAFLVAHLIDARHKLLAVLGGAAENPLTELFADARSIDDVPSLPSLVELCEAWQAVASALASRLAELSAEEIDAPAPQRYPGDDPSVLGALAFLVQHDSYHIGQLALLRRALGLPAMRYGRSARAEQPE